MLTDIWAELGEFVCEHYEAVLTIGLGILIVVVIAQYIINSSLEEDLIELVDRVEALEKLNGIVGENTENSEEE